MSELIKINRDNGIAQVTFNRPEVYNVFDLEMITTLATSLKKLAEDDSVESILLTGSGKAFCAGGDIDWIADFSKNISDGFDELAAQWNLAVTTIQRMNKPVVAAINGATAGVGFSLILACDFRIMEKTAILTQGFTSYGLCIYGGGTFNLSKIVGHARAMEIVAFDKPIFSATALKWGLVTKIVDDGRLVQEAKNMLSLLGKKSKHSFGWSKKLLASSFDNSFELHLEAERKGICSCASHEDGAEGIDAILEKRKPVFEK